ncbi:MAG: class I SAM-dependent methyltransferase [Chloroflexota bacterium]
MASDDKAIALGHPSYVWRAGQERRLRLIQQHVPLQGARILDVGCGLGLYVERLSKHSDQVFGVDIDGDRARAAGAGVPHVCQASAEALPFPDGCFDVVLSNEVLEHVGDEVAALGEAVRVLRPGGKLVLMVPNRLYPFETHGVYWRGRYHFGNVPLVNYLPDIWRNRLAPHVRAYTRRGLTRLLAPHAGSVVVQRCIFAGYDSIAAAHPRLGRWLRRLSYALERTPLQWLGLSHLLVFVKAHHPVPHEARG